MDTFERTGPISGTYQTRTIVVGADHACSIVNDPDFDLDDVVRCWGVGGDGRTAYFGGLNGSAWPIFTGSDQRPPR